MNVTYEIVRMERAATKNSQSPMWRCRTSDGQTVNVFLHTDPSKNSSRFFFAAGYEDVMDDMRLGDVLEWVSSPIRVELRKSGDWWEVAAVELRTANATPDKPWQPDFMAYRARAQRQAVFILESDSICIDIESTGLDMDDEIIAIAAADTNGLVILNGLVRPQTPSKLSRPGKHGKTSSDIHGLYAEDLAHAETLDQWYPKLDEVLSTRKIIGYNVKFDLGMLERNFSDATLHLLEYESVWDVAQLVAEFVGNWNPNRCQFDMISLDAACERFGIVRIERHDARADVLDTVRVLRAMTEANVATWGSQPF